MTTNGLNGRVQPRRARRQSQVLPRQAACDAKLSKYRAILKHDSDITIAASWTAEIERERRRLEREIGRKPTPRKLTENEVKALVVQLRDVVAVLADADRPNKRAIYQEHGVNLTYYPDGRVQVAAGAPHQASSY